MRRELDLHELLRVGGGHLVGVVVPWLCGVDTHGAAQRGMSNLELADVLKAEVQALDEQIGALTRRKKVFQHYLTRCRLGVDPKVILAEIEARGERMPR